MLMWILNKGKSKAIVDKKIRIRVLPGFFYL